jgi:hypothetical protein
LAYDPCFASYWSNGFLSGASGRARSAFGSDGTLYIPSLTEGITALVP